MGKYKNAFKEAEKQLSPERVKRAKSKAQAEVFAIRLGDLREKQGIRQEDVDGFTQSNVSRLESRYDMKLSTLLEYLESIGYAIEISVRPKTGTAKRAVKLLKTG